MAEAVAPLFICTKVPQICPFSRRILHFELNFQMALLIQFAFEIEIQPSIFTKAVASAK
jgi:hypothetical protein